MLQIKINIITNKHKELKHLAHTSQSEMINITIDKTHNKYIYAKK